MSFVKFFIQLFTRAKWWCVAHKRVFIRGAIGAGAVLLFIICIQLLYPGDRFLPFARVQDIPVGGLTKADAEKKITEAYAGATITVKTEQKEYKHAFSDIGLEINAEQTVTQALDYAWAWRLLPGSAVGRMTQNAPVTPRVSEDTLRFFADTLQKENYVGAINAEVGIADGRVVLKPAKSGVNFPVDSVMRQIQDFRLTPTTEIKLASTEVFPGRTDDMLKPLLETAQKAVDTPLKLNLAGEELTVQKDLLVTWLDFPEDPATKQLKIATKPAEVQKYLDSVQGKVYKAPGTTTVTMIDGKESGKVVGANGRGIDAPKTIEQINDVLANAGQEKVIEVPVVALAPKTVFNRTYSNSDAGLQALLQDIANEKGGYGIAVIELGGGGRSASANGGKKFTTASTYKLFVAYAVLKRVEAGQMQWSDTIEGSKNAETCFEIMIVRSDNPCAEAFGAKIGWTNIQNMMRGLGMGSTTLSNEFSSTANDEALFLRKLEDGSLLTGPSREKLLDAMRRQIHRAGIPSGVRVTVADKVGFLNGLLHDAAIVYGPRATYVLVILTDGSSWGNIADAASRIHAHLNK